MDQTVVDKLRSLMAPIFDKYCVVSKDAQDNCIRNILKNGKILDLARNKYDMAAHLDNESALAAFSAGTAIVQKRKKLTLGVSMTAADKAMVIAHNPDYQLEFDMTQRVNHSIPYVQRIIESKRLLGMCRHGNHFITDLGGNPAYHAKAGHSDVHSCVLCNNTRDKGREMVRYIEADALGYVHKLKYCTKGVQECGVDSQEAISVFAIQDIDPIDLVRGLHKKGVEFLTGVFHYDPILYEQESGYFPYFRMHFRRHVVDGVSKVKFFFDNDPSFDYDHDLTNLLKYSRSWSYRMPGTDFTYRYDLTYVKDGIARFTVVRQRREYLGAARNEVAYRYVDHSGSVRVTSWTLDLDSETNSQFRGYKQITLDVSEDLFMFLYKFGLSNDTENPDKLFTVDQLRAQARTFNETRVLNGVAFTGRLLMNPMDLEQLVVAMYVLVLHDMAVENCVSSAQVDTMIGEQKARTERQFLSTTGKIVAFSFALPLIFAHGKFSELLQYVVMWFKQAALAGGLGVEWKRLCSYEPLSSMQRYSGPGTPKDLELSGHSFESQDQVEAFVQPRVVMDLFADVLTDQQRALLDKKLDKPFVKNVVVDVGPPPDVDASRSLSPVKPELSDSDVDSIVWYENDLADYLQVKREVLWRRSEEHEVVSNEEVNSHAGAAILEHARYNFDVALSQVAAAQDQCRATYSAAPLGNKIQIYNDSEDAGIRYLNVVSGQVHVPAGERYAFGIDPVSCKYYEIHSSASQSFISSKSVSLLFVSKDTIILNGFHIGRSLLQIALRSSNLQTSYSLVDAIFGAGKTHEILQKFEVGDVVVTQTTASKEDIYETLLATKKFDASYLRKAVKTADSAVMHGLPKATTVYLDEGLMMFPGQLYAVATMTRAKHMYVYGDSAQIPPIDRSATLGFLTYQGMCRWNSIEFRDITYRSPADVVHVLADYFKLQRKDKLATANPIKRSLSLVVVGNPKEMTEYGVDVGWHYVTILRSDRSEFLTNPKFRDGKKFRIKDLQTGECRLLNVGEAQGATFAKVKIIRKFPYSDELFKSPEHTVVAFSRHLLEATYVTSVRNDPFAVLVARAMAATEGELEARQVDTPKWLHDRLAKVKRTGVA